MSEIAATLDAEGSDPGVSSHMRMALAAAPFIAPTLLLLAAFTYWPILEALWDAVHITSRAGLTTAGFDNFRALFADPHSAFAYFDSRTYYEQSRWRKLDFFGSLPPDVPIATNAGAYAEGMAEHALAMTLAAAKRLFVEHAALQAGVFNQFRRNRVLRGAVCGILGFGGIGQATARMMRGLGMRIHAMNRSGRTADDVDWIGTQDDLPALLRAADVLIVSAPLTRRTLGLIGAAELALMKPDAILVNLARGELIAEAALFAHLQTHPDFFACIDAWWIEPVRHGVFRVDHPFLTLPNVIGSPHNSGSVPGNMDTALHRALDNILRVVNGEPPAHLIGVEERML